MSTLFRHAHIPVGAGSLHVVEAGDPRGRPYLFLHGWPQSWRSWEEVMALAAPEARAIAIDLPGVGESAGSGSGSKRQLAAVVRALVAELGLAGLTLVGHDVGGMIAYAYLRQYAGAARVVIMDTVIPGVDPWPEVLANPYLWHFALHSVPALPETLVRGRQADYFGFFYDVLSADPSRITPQARAEYVTAYRSDAALTAGFDFYRAFAQDARDNAGFADASATDTPLLYLRGEREGGDIARYATGFRSAGVTNVVTALVPDAGHFSPDEAPADVWRYVSQDAVRPAEARRATR
jgi:pimeloyl-ACP methyl ester carboxylesterase